MGESAVNQTAPRTLQVSKPIGVLFYVFDSRLFDVYTRLSKQSPVSSGNPENTSLMQESALSQEMSAAGEADTVWRSLVNY